MVSNLLLIGPECWLLGMSCLLLVVGTWWGQRQVTDLLTTVALLGALGLTGMEFSSPTQSLFDQAFGIDPMALLLKGVLFGLGLFVSTYSIPYLKQKKISIVEYQVLFLLSILGISILISAQHLITLFLGLELFSLPTYAMVALHQEDAKGAEAAMKLFVMSALSTGFLLYGFSLLYGVTQALSLPQIASHLDVALGTHPVMALFALAFVVVAIAFKLGLVPFHMWLPDTYQGAPDSVTLYVGSLPKLAGFALLIRLLVNALPTMNSEWSALLVGLAILSMGLGNLAAIWQKSLKRLLAYSSIAQMGTMVIPIAVGDTQGYTAALFYVITYVLSATAAFGLLVAMSRQNADTDTLEYYRGLNQRSPLAAFLWLVILFSLAGIPPFVGFFAKFSALQPLIAHDWIGLAVTTVVLAVIGAYYYLRVVKMMYFEEPLPEVSPLQGPVLEMKKQPLLLLNILLLIVVGVAPGTLYGWCNQIF